MLLDLTMIFPLQDVHLNSPCSRSVSGDSYPRQKGQPLSLQTDGGGGQGARGKHGLSPWGLWLYWIKSRGDSFIVWEFDRRHNFTIHTASQVEEKRLFLCHLFVLCLREKSNINMGPILTIHTNIITSTLFQRVGSLAVSGRISWARTRLGVWQTHLQQSCYH